MLRAQCDQLRLYKNRIQLAFYFLSCLNEDYDHHSSYRWIVLSCNYNVKIILSNNVKNIILIPPILSQLIPFLINNYSKDW